MQSKTWLPVALQQEIKIDRLIDNDANSWIFRDRNGGKILLTASIGGKDDHCEIELHLYFCRDAAVRHYWPQSIAVDVHGVPKSALFLSAAVPHTQSHEPEQSAWMFSVRNNSFYHRKTNPPPRDTAKWTIDYSQTKLPNNSHYRTKQCVLKAKFRVQTFPFVFEMMISELPRASLFRKLPLVSPPAWHRWKAIHLQVVRDADLRREREERERLREVAMR